MNAYRIAIVGRPNVGKSTLFNRLIGKRRALVHDLPGVTRDRLEEKTEWWFQRKAYPIHLVDTGGLGGEHFAKEIEQQVDIALSEADAVIFVFDAQTGITPLDEELIRKFKRSGVLAKMPVIAAVNKVDAEAHEERIADFFEAGLDPVLTISAEHGRGMDDLQQALLEALIEKMGTEAADVPDAAAEPEERLTRITVIGRPNVGKSTLVNAVLGETRMIASPIAGTTVDAVDSLVTLSGKPYLLVDTAGIRRKSKTEQGIEVLSVVQARKSLERSDVAILMLDGEQGIIDQDEKIGGLVEEVGCSVILALNKWDTQRKNANFTKEVAAERIRKQMAYLKYAPMIFISAKNGEGFQDLGDLIEEIVIQRRTKIATKEFTEWVKKESAVHNPFNAKFYMCHQSGRNPPTFVCHVSDPKKIHFSLQRHLVNAMRERWGFVGSPIRLLFVASASTRAKPKKK